MSSWLRAAEDLFEVVDRRAKLVVSELAEDEQNDSAAPTIHPQGLKAKRTKPNTKANRRNSADGPNTAKTVQGQSLTNTPQLDLKSDQGATSVALENRSLSDKSLEQKNDLPHSSDKYAPVLSSPSLEKQVDVAKEHEADLVEVPISQNASEAAALVPAPNVELTGENAIDVTDDRPPSDMLTQEIEETSKDSLVEIAVVQTVEAEEPEVPAKVEKEKPQSETIIEPREIENQLKDVEKMEPSVDKKQQIDQKTDASTTPMKIQDALDEAQMLLQSSVSTGKSKEARLSRVCNGLATRLQEYKSENAQLEELLVAERELSKSYEAHIKQLQNDVSTSKKEVTRIESSMAEALAAKNSEIEALSNSVDSLKKQLALSEGSLASMQANVESVMRNRELTETRMMQALREELASTERRAEEERAAHNATKKAAMEREVELEHQALEASTALARTQRLADERTAKAAEFEQKLAFYEVENASLTQELQDVKALARRGQKKSAEETNQAIQMQAWQEEAERARQGQRDAESKLSTLEVEIQKMRVELAGMKRDAEHYSRQEHMELEKRYRELTDLLYYKQTQLEAMASDKAAAEFQLEKELKRLQEAQVEAERSRVSRRASSSWEDSDSEMKVLEPLPLHHRHMAAANIQLQKAAKFLDSGAVRATRFLWRYPLARLLLFFYLVFVHLFLMYLLHRLQEREDYDSAREIAETMGLANRTLE